MNEDLKSIQGSLQDLTVMAKQALEIKRLKQILNQLLPAAEKARVQQKGYYSAKDPDIKKAFLIGSKQAERELDNVIFNIRQSLK